MNTKLLRDTLAYIQKLPTDGDHYAEDIWKQESWGVYKQSEDTNECGTAACFAGWAHILNNPNRSRQELMRQCGSREGMRALDIDGMSANILFLASNSLREIEKIVDVILLNGKINTQQAEAITGRPHYSY